MILASYNLVIMIVRRDSSTFFKAIRHSSTVTDFINVFENYSVRLARFSSDLFKALESADHPHKQNEESEAIRRRTLILDSSVEQTRQHEQTNCMQRKRTTRRFLVRHTVAGTIVLQNSARRLWADGTWLCYLRKASSVLHFHMSKDCRRSSEARMVLASAEEGK